MAILHRILSRGKRALLPLRIRYALGGLPNPVIVEVGANDGKTGDPLYRLIRSSTRGRALLIEPVPHLFERLRAAYAGNNHCILENVAIGPTAGTLAIYFLDPGANTILPNLPSYFEELASMDRSKVAGLAGDRQDLVRERLVRTVPLRALLAEHGINRVDLLQIDTEGFDFEVLKTFPFDLTRPRLVCFENSHLSDSDRAASVDLMVRNGYRVERWGKDFVCARRNR